MKAKDLIKMLKAVDPETEIFVSDHSGYEIDSEDFSDEFDLYEVDTWKYMKKRTWPEERIDISYSTCIYDTPHIQPWEKNLTAEDVKIMVLK